MSPERKQLLLRIDPAVHDALARWANAELRSLNAQIEMLLRRALDDAGRMPRQAAPMITATTAEQVSRLRTQATGCSRQEGPRGSVRRRFGIATDGDPRRRRLKACGSVNGHRVLPNGGHEFPHWWPFFLATVPQACTNHDVRVCLRLSARSTRLIRGDWTNWAPFSSRLGAALGEDLISSCCLAQDCGVQWRTVRASLASARDRGDPPRVATRPGGCRAPVLR